MTTIYKKMLRCCVCGAENEFVGIGSTNAFGSSDLDTRPPEMKRSTMFAWVLRCPGCGYCADDVSELRANAETVVQSIAYKRQLDDKSYPALANSFICEAMIEQGSGDPAAAAWALIHAAWACDDSGRADRAQECRQKAADMLLAAEARGHQVVQQEGASTAILVDLLRRSGQFDQARGAIAARRDGVAEEIIIRILDFQTVLIGKNDTSCHTVAEALGED